VPAKISVLFAFVDSPTVAAKNAARALAISSLTPSGVSKYRIRKDPINNAEIMTENYSHNPTDNNLFVVLHSPPRPRRDFLNRDQFVDVFIILRSARSRDKTWITRSSAFSISC